MAERTAEVAVEVIGASMENERIRVETSHENGCLSSEVQGKTILLRTWLQATLILGRLG